MAIKSNILYTDEDRVNVSFTGKFIRFLTRPDKDRVRRTNSNYNKSRPLGRLALMEYYTMIELVNYLGLTYEEFFDLPAKDPSKLRVIFDLGEWDID